MTRTPVTIVVGDVHGCLEEFDELIRITEYQRGHDRLVLLGDLLDRGPDSAGVVRRAREIGAESVLGNHDEKHLRWRRHENRRRADSSYVNPMRPFSDAQRAEHDALSDADIAWLEQLPFTIALGPNWIAVHAGFEPAYPLEKQRPDKMLRVRYVDAGGKSVPIANDVDQPDGTVRWATAWKYPHHVIYGHHSMSFERPTVDTWLEDDSTFALATMPPGETAWKRYGIDTGCCFGGSLTAFLLWEDHCGWQHGVANVRAKRKYADIWRGDTP